MKIEELRNKLEEDEKNTQSSIDKLRDNINKKELKELSENKDFYENQLIDELGEKIKEYDSKKVDKYIYTLLKSLKKIGILSAFINIAHLLGRTISYIQDKFNWHSKNRKQDEIIRWVINLFIALIIAIPIVVIKKIVIFILTK